MSKIEKLSNDSDKITVYLFLFLPAIMLILGYFLYPYPSSSFAQQLTFIPMYAGAIFLLIGFLLREKKIGRGLKIVGWFTFAFFWSTQPSHLYFSEGGDVFNAAVGIIGVYALMYFAYHEWLAFKRNEYVNCLNWIAGVASICGLIYYIMENSSLAMILIRVVADQSVMVLNFLTNSSFALGGNTFYGAIVNDINGSYVVTIIFACTAVQAMVLFVGLILALNSIGIKKKIIGLLITIVPIYILNLLRNSMVVFLLGNKITSFDIAHNVLSKAGALITLIVLLFVVFKIIPELYDEIVCLIDLPKKKGPVENFFAGLMGKKQNENR